LPALRLLSSFRRSSTPTLYSERAMREPDGTPPDPFLRRLSSLLQSLEGWGSFRIGARAAAVVAVLYRQKEQFYIPFVVRRTDLPSQRGQVALPGGQVRPGDAAGEGAARGGEEEIGARRAALVPLGAGPPLYAAVTNYSVVPFVAWLPVEGV